MARFDISRVPRRNMVPLSVNVEIPVWEWLDSTYRTYSMGKDELVERLLCQFLPKETMPEEALEVLTRDYFEEEDEGKESVTVSSAIIEGEKDQDLCRIDLTNQAYNQLLELETLTGKNINIVLAESIDHVYLETIRSKAAQEAQIELPKRTTIGTVEDKLAALIGSKNKKVEKELIGVHLSTKVCKLLREFKKATDVDMSDTVEAAVLHLLKDFAETIEQ